ncbi:hypothetical protein NIES4071_76760 [Calothrix sp. NIES-4071]|nr:hypothetical protein NIES4071_76760 [Calothrix sp. NIES-4071]BAZ61950.1 hypothetical protein NIES4105_76700 [Calothrix sp. NIES-4105]
MKKYLIGLTFGCAICLEPTLAFGQTTNNITNQTTNVNNPSVVYPVSGASISGAVTYQSAANVITTISGQITLPQNLYYNGSATITYQTTSPTDLRPTSLTLTPEANSIQVVDTSSSISAVTATELKNALNPTTGNLQRAITIIRAAGGTDGLE